MGLNSLAGKVLIVAVAVCIMAFIAGAIVEWMRQYHAQRGEKPFVEFEKWHVSIISFISILIALHVIRHDGMGFEVKLMHLAMISLIDSIVYQLCEQKAAQ